MKFFIIIVAFTISIIAAKIVFIILASPALFIPYVSNSNILGGIDMGIAVVVGIGSAILCFKWLYKYLLKEMPGILHK